jgi:hypothetical protein
LFLGRPLTIATKIWSEASVGRIPQALLEEQHGALLSLHETNADLVSFC